MECKLQSNKFLNQTRNETYYEFFDQSTYQTTSELIFSLIIFLNSIAIIWNSYNYSKKVSSSKFII